MGIRVELQNPVTKERIIVSPANAMDYENHLKWKRVRLLHDSHPDGEVYLSAQEILNLKPTAVVAKKVDEGEIELVASDSDV